MTTTDRQIKSGETAVSSIAEIFTSAISLGDFDGRKKHGDHIHPDGAYQIATFVPYNSGEASGSGHGDLTINVYNRNKLGTATRDFLLESYTITDNGTDTSDLKNIEGMFLGTEKEIKLGFVFATDGRFSPVIQWAIFSLAP
jgi:hypothetical protein